MEKFYDGNFLLWLSYMLHTIEIENVFEKYFCWIVALEYILELFQVYNCGQRKLEYSRVQITECASVCPL